MGYPIHRVRYSLLVGLLTAFLVMSAALAVAQDDQAESAPSSGSKTPSPEELEASGAVIGQIVFAKQNVFDTTQPGENKSLYRLANRWHIMTRDSVVRQQLLFRPGDVYSKRLLDESERLLRRNSYLYDAKITVIGFKDGVVDLQVWTRDLWTLMPGLSVSRSGGENRSRISVSERNLVGTGITLKLSYTDNVDRNSTSFEFLDRNLGNSFATLYFRLAENSDGHNKQFNLNRPFYSLDTRWTAGISYLDDAHENSFYETGDEVAEYAVESEYYSAFTGWSAGLANDWVRRWTMGVVHDKDAFSAVTDGTLPALVPEDRLLNYPFIGFELLEDRFQTANNRDQIGRTEDFYLGTRIYTSLGWADEEFGSDRDSLVYTTNVSTGLGEIEKKALFLSSYLTGRIDEGSSANTRFGIDLRYYNQISNKRLFFMTLGADIGNNLDLDALFELGGDNGLRGYPLRYQTGDSRLLFTIEQRYFTDWYPFRLFRVGGAIFADAGRTWGENPVGGPPQGWLKDVGIGLRLGPTRASGRDVIHVDIAFPLDGDPSIDSVQLLIQSKRSF